MEFLSLSVLSLSVLSQQFPQNIVILAAVLSTNIQKSLMTLISIGYPPVLTLHINTLIDILLFTMLSYICEWVTHSYHWIIFWTLFSLVWWYFWMVWGCSGDEGVPNVRCAFADIPSEGLLVANNDNEIHLRWKAFPLLMAVCLWWYTGEERYVGGQRPCSPWFGSSLPPRPSSIP